MIRKYQSKRPIPAEVIVGAGNKAQYRGKLTFLDNTISSDRLPPPQLSLATRIWMGVLRGYVVLAVVLVVYKMVALALHGGGS